MLLYLRFLQYQSCTMLNMDYQLDNYLYNRGNRVIRGYKHGYINRYIWGLCLCLHLLNSTLINLGIYLGIYHGIHHGICIFRRIYNACNSEILTWLPHHSIATSSAGSSIRGRVAEPGCVCGWAQPLSVLPVPRLSTSCMYVLTSA